MKITIDFTQHYHNGGQRLFQSKEEAFQWILSGILACDGAELRHYSSMLSQLQSGATRLFY